MRKQHIMAGYLGGVLLAALLVAGWSCGSTVSVTSHGVPVTDTTFVTVSVAVHAIEAASVALGDWLIAQHHTACFGKPLDVQEAELPCVRATGNLKSYATVYTPRILAALQAARDQLKVVAGDPKATTQEKLNEAVSALSLAFAQAAEWGRTQGWPHAVAPIGPPLK
jgi:hypothetical protein